MRWLSGSPRPPRGVFLVHGEPDSAAALAKRIRLDRGWKTTVAKLGDVAPLKG